MWLCRSKVRSEAIDAKSKARTIAAGKAPVRSLMGTEADL